MIEVLAYGGFALLMAALLYRAKGHGDRAEAALAAIRRIRDEVWRRLDGDDGKAAKTQAAARKVS